MLPSKNVATSLHTNFILNEINKTYKSCTSVDRFKKANQNLPVVKASFTDKDEAKACLDDGIFLGSLFIKPETFIDSKQPTRCFNCQKFNHIGINCQTHDNPTCVRCSGNHNHKIDKCNNPMKCSNCKGNHFASSKLCPMFLDMFKKLKN